MKHPAKSLRSAAEHLLKHGWAQGQYKTSDGRSCVGRALGVTDAPTASWLAFWSFIGTREHMGWNDAPMRTLDEVVEALCGAADRFEAEHPEWPR